MSVTDAAKKLVERLDEIARDPRYQSVWTMYAIHGMTYDGPFYVDELNELRRALGMKTKK